MRFNTGKIYLNKIAKISILGMVIISIGSFLSINSLIKYTETNLESTTTSLHETLPLYESTTHIKDKVKTIRLEVMEVLATKNYTNLNDLFTHVDKLNYDIDNEIDVLEKNYDAAKTEQLKTDILEWRIKRHNLFGELMKGDYKTATEVAIRDNFAEEEYNKVISDIDSIHNEAIINVNEYTKNYSKFNHNFRNNAYFWFLMLLIWSATIIFLILSIIIKQENLLRAEATRDFLTGVYNRRELTRQFNIKQMFSKPDSTVGILNIDLDHFKSINDTFGHAAGDIALKEFCSLVNKIIRSNDILARNGGEEFIILMDNVTNDQLYGVAEKIRKKIEEHTFSYNGTKFKVTISIGVIIAKTNETTLNDLISKSDEKLYQSKKSGRNCITFDSSNPSEKSVNG